MEHLGKNILYTERLELHKADASYAERLLGYVLENRDQHSSLNPVRQDLYYTLEEQRARLSADADSLVKYCVFKKEDAGHMIGDINFSNTIRGVLCACFIGYSIHHEAEGQGLMTEALQAAIPHFFKESGLHRISAHIMPQNKASIRIVEKLGFKEEGYFRKYLKINGKWEDHLAYSLLAEEIIN